MISREQIKAGRAMLDWSQKDLAQHSGVSDATIKLIETARINSTPETRQTIQEALEKGGLEFLPQNGVRMRDDLLTVLEKRDEDDSVFLRLLDDIYYTMRRGYGEVLWSFVDDSLSSPEVLEKDRLIRGTGCGMRSLVRHGDTYLIYPIEEYRYLPKGLFLNNTSVVYGNKFALVVDGSRKVIIINNEAIADVKRMEFEIIWVYGDAPTHSTAQGKALD
jgi:transcriptional regulator with XRE-family HTH domain